MVEDKKACFSLLKGKSNFPGPTIAQRKWAGFVGVRSNLSGVPWYRRPVMKKLPTKPWSTHLFVFFFSEKSSKHIESVKKTISFKKKTAKEK